MLPALQPTRNLGGPTLYRVRTRFVKTAARRIRRMAFAVRGATPPALKFGRGGIAATAPTKLFGKHCRDPALPSTGVSFAIRDESPGTRCRVHPMKKEATTERHHATHQREPRGLHGQPHDGERAR